MRFHLLVVIVDSERFVCRNLFVAMHSQRVLANRQCIDVRPWLITSFSSSCSYRIQLRSSTYRTPLQLDSLRHTQALMNSSSRIARRRCTEEFKVIGCPEVYNKRYIHMCTKNLFAC